MLRSMIDSLSFNSLQFEHQSVVYSVYSVVEISIVSVNVITACECESEKVTREARPVSSLFNANKCNCYGKNYFFVVRPT